MPPLALALVAPLVLGGSTLGAQDVPAGPSSIPSTPPGPGISHELALHRTATLSDITYDAAFHVPADPAGEVTGEVSIGFRRSGIGPVVVDFADPARVRSVEVDGRAVRYEGVNGHLVIPGSELPGGRISLTVSFVSGDAPLNRRDEFLYTLFVPDRAHEVLPSFDQPDLKARFRLRLTVPRGWTAVANGALEQREAHGDEVVYRFRETEPLPTYLFAFAAGEFQVEEAERGGRRIRLIHRETDAGKVSRNREAVFDLHATALTWLEEYTGIPYPFGKFDVVAIPSFQYNGMEHPGAILYRASSLFLDESATRNQELGRASVIAHETAHMWFGDLVTMRWFDDVWMKEVFANFMAAKIVNPSFPDLDHELRFLLAHYPSAYDVDRTAGANAIRQPLENLADAGTLYGAIIYQKAPIVMRQLERLVGEVPFRTALRRYLDAHRFGNAGWPALVAELDRVTPLDVGAWSRVWIEEPGRPVIHVDRRPNEVLITPSDPAERGRVWPQRTTVALLSDQLLSPRPGAPETDAASAADAADAADAANAAGQGRRHELTVVTNEVTLSGDPVGVPLLPGLDGAILPNADGLGYGLFDLDDVTRERLLEGLPYLPEPLHRAVAWLDLRELMLEGDVAPTALLDLGVRVVAGEGDELVAQQVLGDVTEVFWRYLRPEVRERRAPRLERVLWDRVEEVEGASAKAAYFNAWRSVATSTAAVERLRAVWAGEREIEGLPLSERDRTSMALQLAIRDPANAEATLEAQESAIENPDRRERFAFVRRAASPDAAARDSFFASLAEVENRAREEWVTTALSLLHHPLRAERSLRYIRPSLDLLVEVKETGDIFFPTRWLSATLGGHASPEAAAVVRAFLHEHPDFPPRLLGKLLQQADPLFRSVALRSP